MVSGGSTNLLERYYNQYMQEYQMTPDNGTTTDGNTIRYQKGFFMNGQKQKFSELKKQAREAMAGRCGTLVGATAINLFLTFSCSLIPTLIFQAQRCTISFPESDAVPVFPAPQPLSGGLLKDLPLNAARGTDFRR